MNSWVQYLSRNILECSGGHCWTEQWCTRISGLQLAEQMSQQYWCYSQSPPKTCTSVAGNLESADQEDYTPRTQSWAAIELTLACALMQVCGYRATHLLHPCSHNQHHSLLERKRAYWPHPFNFIIDHPHEIGAMAAGLPWCKLIPATRTTV